MSRRTRPLFSRRWRWYRRLWLHVVFPRADLNKREHRVAAEHAFADVWFSRWYPFYLFAVISAAYCGCMAAFMYFAVIETFAQYSSSQTIIIHLIVSLLLFIALPVLGAAIVDGALLFCVRAIIGRSVRRSIRRSGVDLCVNCGYLLKGVPAEGTCPECGAERERLTRYG